MEKIVVSCLESRIDENQSVYSRFLLGPFISGHAVTVATALRRALLSEVKNIAITALHIQGVTHEFSTLVGIRESVLELSLNFQQIILSTQTKSKSVKIGYLHVQGPAIVHANDLKLPDGIECVNPTQYIATLSTEGLLVVKFLISEKKSFLKSNTSTLNSKKIKEAKLYSAQLSKALLSPVEYDPHRLFRLLRNQNLPNGSLVRKTIEAKSTSQFANSSSANFNFNLDFRKPKGRPAKSSSSKGKVSEVTKTSFLEEPGSTTPPSEFRASRQNTLFEKSNFLSPSVGNWNFLPATVAELDSQSEPNFSLKKQNIVEPRSTKMEFLTGSGRNEAASVAGPIDQRSGSKKISKAPLSRNESARSEPAVGPIVQKSLEPDLEQLERSSEPPKGVDRTEFRQRPKVGGMPRITDSILDHRANYISDDFNSEVCLRTIIPLDPIFTPVYQVNFGIERDDLSNQIRERVIMEVWTNGSIHPRQAINEAALSTMSIFSKLRKTFQLDSHSLALSTNSTVPLTSFDYSISAKVSGSRLRKTKNITKGERVNADASESVEPLAALLSLALRSRAKGARTPLGSLILGISSQAPLLREYRGILRTSLRGVQRRRAPVTRDRFAPVAQVRTEERLLLPKWGKSRVSFEPPSGVAVTPDRPRLALAKLSITELDLTSSVRQKFNNSASLGFRLLSEAEQAKAKHPVSLCLQNFARSHVKGQTFLFIQSFGLKARFFKGLARTRLAKTELQLPPKGVQLRTGLSKMANFRFGFGFACSASQLLRRCSESKRNQNRSVVPGKRVLAWLPPVTKRKFCASRLEYTFDNQFLSGATGTQDRHTFKRTFLPSFKVVLGPFESLRNDVSARTKSISSRCTRLNLEQNQAGLTKAELLFKLRFSLTGAQTFPPFCSLLRRCSKQSGALQAKVRKKFLLRESVSEAFKPSWIGSRCFATQSNLRAVNRISIGLGRLLLVLSKSEQKGEHRSRLSLPLTFASQKCAKLLANFCLGSPHFCVAKVSKREAGTTDRLLPKGAKKDAVLSEAEQPSESANSQAFVLAKAMKSGALQRKTRPYEGRRFGNFRYAQGWPFAKLSLAFGQRFLVPPLQRVPKRISCFRSDLLSNKVSSNLFKPSGLTDRRRTSFGSRRKPKIFLRNTVSCVKVTQAFVPEIFGYRKPKKGATLLRKVSTFRLSNNRSSSQLLLDPSWSTFRLPFAEQTQARVTARIEQTSETKQFACSAKVSKQLQPKPILFLIKYRTFCFTRNALRLFRSKQENSLLLLPLAKQLFRVKMARVFTSCLPLISQKFSPTLPSSFAETQAFSNVHTENRLSVKQLLLSLAASFTFALRSGAKRESTLSLRTPEAGNRNSVAAILQGETFLTPNYVSVLVSLACSASLSLLHLRKSERSLAYYIENVVSETKTEAKVPARRSRMPGLGRNLKKKGRESIFSNRPEKTGRQRPVDRTEGLSVVLVTAEGGSVLKGRAPQKKIAFLIALRAKIPFERNYVSGRRFAASKLWLRSNLKRQFGFFQFACNGSRPLHLRGLVQGSMYKSLGGCRSAITPRGLKERWQRFAHFRLPFAEQTQAKVRGWPKANLSESSPKLGSAWIHRGVERFGMCVSKGESLEKGKRPGSVGVVSQRLWFPNPTGSPTFGWPLEPTVFRRNIFSCFAHFRLPFAEQTQARVTPLIIAKAPPLCLSSGLVTFVSSLGSTGLRSRNSVLASKSYANSSEAIIRSSILLPQAGTGFKLPNSNFSLRLLTFAKQKCAKRSFASKPKIFRRNTASLLSEAEQAKDTPSPAKVRGARGAEGGKRLSIIYSSNLDKMSFLSSDLANISLSLRTYTFLKKKGKNNIASLLEYSPNTLFSLLNGDKKMFHEIERCLFFLGLPFKERSWRT
nr:RNA polymerase alpha subunit [Chloroidium sp. KL-2023a]